MVVQGDHDSLLEYLDKPGGEPAFGGMYFPIRDQPKAPKLFSTLRIRTSHRNSSSSKKPLVTGPLSPTVNADPSPSPKQVPETFQATFTWIQEMAKDVIAQV